MSVRHVLLGAAALSQLLATAATAQVAPPPVVTAPAKPAGSAYLQCDGQPNNMTDGEMAARLLGAVTLLGLFAKAPESADASKRLSGAAGVAACSSLIEGERKEGNPNRRIGLILGRAIHQIEAKNYDAAMADVAMARREAEAAGLTRDPYWQRSRGRSFDQLEAAILFRQGKAAEAQAVSLRMTEAQRYALFGLADLDDYQNFVAQPAAIEDQRAQAMTRLFWVTGVGRASRLEQAGRYAEAAKLRDALIDFDTVHTPETNNSALMAQAAISHALAGNWEIAAARATAARANSEARTAAGKPEDSQSELVELLDLYGILDTAHKGDVKAARRLFSARSQWVSPSYGAVSAVNRQLREGASADELIGGLAKTPEQLWAERVEAKKAALLAKDSDNKTLFSNLTSAQSPASYTGLSKNIWQTDKSRLILKKKADSKDPFQLMYQYGLAPDVAQQAYLLHAALMSKAQGQPGFVFQPIMADSLFAGSFRPGKLGDKGFAPELYYNADEVIAALRVLFPDPATLKAQAAAKK
ncbi:hypothetical protein [Sphingomonas astaxanthinifaciens]|uniref:Tetratricopeptide repeat-containing protein n=1 Tax=Sphingomonas astaxanthinifaciens DSM 22298 TaxID=1123267 RepID=A0ABQ5Z771_9SPHN|nr:hypothetical protein [Sphingomonas astaxanthinifaciens]GLR47822.1 hypothetical protein GCM10007925_15350 [Sphingomonas astaxanthinifaciens DSM 22298]